MRCGFRVSLILASGLATGAAAMDAGSERAFVGYDAFIKGKLHGKGAFDAVSDMRGEDLKAGDTIGVLTTSCQPRRTADALTMDCRLYRDHARFSIEFAAGEALEKIASMASQEHVFICAYDSPTTCKVPESFVKTMRTAAQPPTLRHRLMAPFQLQMQ